MNIIQRNFTFQGQGKFHRSDEEDAIVNNFF